MEEKITLCGDNCIWCPRYNAHSEAELRKVAELWHRVGWRDTVVSNDEIACDRYLELLRDDGPHHDQIGHDVVMMILDFCKEAKSVPEIMEKFGFESRTSFRRKYLKVLMEEGKLKMTMPDKPKSKNQKYYS